MLLKKKFLNIIRGLDDIIYDNFGPVRIIFLIRNQIGWLCLLPIIKELIHMQNIKLGITVEFEGCVEIPKEGEEATIFDKYYIKPDKAIYMKWHHIVMSNSSTLYFKRHATNIFTHHGCSFGSLDASADATHFDQSYEVKMFSESELNICFCKSSEEYKNILRKKPSLTDQRKLRFFISGLARIDLLMQTTSKQGDEYLTSLGLDSSKKTILVGSHWEPKSLLMSFGSKIIENLCEMGSDYNILVMGHGRLWQDANGNENNIELYQTLTDLCASYPQLRFLPHHGDTSALIKCADIFLCDNSSVFVEFCIMDKPILFFDHPKFNFQDQLIADRYRLASFSFNQQSDITSIIDNAIENPDCHKEERKKTADFFLSNKGHSSQYIAHMLIKIGRVSGPKSRQWNNVIELSEKSLVEHDLKCSKND